MKPRIPITQLSAERLRELLNYDPDTGVFTWRVSKGSAAAGSVSGCIDSTEGYRRIMINSINYYASRLAWLYMTGRFPADQIDHIDHDRTNDRFTNLREVSHKINGRNQSLHVTNTSGIVGVRWNKRHKKWYARIKINGKLMHLGCFNDFDEAVKVRKQTERQYGFHSNHGCTHYFKPAKPGEAGE